MTTTTVRAATHGAGRARLDHALEQRQTFTTSGALWGHTYKHGRTIPRGRLNDEEWLRLQADAGGPGIAFAVYSYATPIAWVTHAGHVYYVRQRFSVTTSKHQTAIHRLGEEPA